MTRIISFEHDREEYVVVSIPSLRPAVFAALTRAEVEVVEAVLEGQAQREIARARGASTRTVSNQIARAYRKLGVTSATELAALVAGANRPQRG
jgi:DNA-binding NarL/FixJ family response regulator